MGRPLNHGLPNGSGMGLMTHGAHGFWRSMALGANVMALECGSEQWMDGSGCLVYKVSGPNILGQIAHSTRLYSNTKWPDQGEDLSQSHHQMRSFRTPGRR